MPPRQSNAARPAPTFTAMDLVGKLRFHYDMKVRPRINPDLRRLNALAQRPLPFEPLDARTHLQRGFQWMWDAHLAVGRQGLPTKFSIGPQYGVGVPYPETTGYTLNTFLAALPLAKELGFDEERLHALIGNCTRFLLGEQLPNGAFTGGHRKLRNYGRPSIFNTGQILLGLSAVLEHCATHTPPAAWQLDVERLRAAVNGAGDFLADQPSTRWGRVQPTYKPGVVLAPLKNCLPHYVIETLKEAIMYFDTRIKGFAMPDSILTGVETRSSAPVRINRDENAQSNIRGLYPMGEGAGYAGGIVSSAVDGIKTAEKIMLKYAPLQ